MTTPGGLLLVLAVLVPFLGMLLGLALGGRRAQHLTLVTIGLGLWVAVLTAHTLLRWVKLWSTCWAAGSRPSASRSARTDCRWS